MKLIPMTCHSRVEQVIGFSVIELRLAGKHLAMCHTHTACPWFVKDGFDGPRAGINMFSGFTLTIIPQDPAFLFLQRLLSGFKMKPTCLLEFEISHYYPST